MTNKEKALNWWNQLSPYIQKQFGIKHKSNKFPTEKDILYIYKWETADI